MIQRLYVHNYRCLDNFDLPLGGLSSTLLIGRNGAGKTTVGLALEVLQRIGRGVSRVADLVRLHDLADAHPDAPMRFEVEVTLSDRLYAYSVAFEFPSGFRELRVREERLAVDGTPVFTRKLARVYLGAAGQDTDPAFGIDWHVVALPIIQARSAETELALFNRWLAQILILRPVPSLSSGESTVATLHPDNEVSNIGAWFSGVVANAPATYASLSDFLTEVMPDFSQITNVMSGRDTRSLRLEFRTGDRKLEIPVDRLSDGERCFVIFALTIATNNVNGPLLCFWDEPDNFLAPPEVGQTVMALRRAFADKGQLVLTSHNPEAIRQFSDENTLVLSRKNHMEPTVRRFLSELVNNENFGGSFIEALVRGDVDA